MNWYFVSFSHVTPLGVVFANCEMSLDRPVTRLKVLNMMKQEMEKAGFSQPVILFWARMEDRL